MKVTNNVLRTLVLIWTVLTTTFFWTSTMRMLLKPEISSWGINNLHGTGLTGDYWFPPIIILLALFIFYLEGRGRYRLLYHLLIISWHILIAGVIAYGSLEPNAQASFETWGVDISLLWLNIPAVVFLLIAIAHVLVETREIKSIPVYSWKKINWKPLTIVLVLFPLVLIFFRLGTGFNWQVKVAVASTIIQWILITEAVGRPYKRNKTVNQSLEN